MGTSKSYGGPSKGLVPSWVDSPVPGAAPATLAPQAPVPAPPPGTQPDTTGAGVLSGARGSFSRFARTGSRSALGNALSNYVRHGTGGAGRASRRMATSRAVGAGILGIARNVQQFGAEETLRRLNVPVLAGQPAADVFLAILDFVCPPGGALDESIARQAMLETICDLADLGIGNFDTMTPDQMKEFFLDFVSRSIEGRVMADLGARGVTLPDDIASVERAQQQLHDFVTGCTRGALSARLDNIGNLTDQEIELTVNQIYEIAFDLVSAAGEAEA